MIPHNHRRGSSKALEQNTPTVVCHQGGLYGLAAKGK